MVCLDEIRFSRYSEKGKLKKPLQRSYESPWNKIGFLKSDDGNIIRFEQIHNVKNTYLFNYNV